jgi:hypothetical protein
MTATNVVAFPFPTKRHAEPPRQALRHDGMPLRVGDAVRVRSPARHGIIGFAGTVTKVGVDGAYPDCKICQIYEIMCHDGFTRIVTADHIEAVS